MIKVCGSCIAPMALLLPTEETAHSQSSAANLPAVGNGRYGKCRGCVRRRTIMDVAAGLYRAAIRRLPITKHNAARARVQLDGSRSDRPNESVSRVVEKVIARIPEYACQNMLVRHVTSSTIYQPTR